MAEPEVKKEETLSEKIAAKNLTIEELKKERDDIKIELDDIKVQLEEAEKEANNEY